MLYCRCRWTSSDAAKSFLDSDRDFAKVEKNVKLHQNIFSVDEYHSIMARSQLKERPNVSRLEGKFISLKELPKALSLTNRTVNTEGEKVFFRDSVRWVRVTQFGRFYYKHSLRESEEWKTADLHTTRNKTATAMMNTSQIHLQSRVVKKSALKPAKIADIVKQLPYIPHGYRNYYEQITLSSVSDAAIDRDEEDEEEENEEDVAVEQASSQ